ncbi:MAG: hypothetical protein E6J91_11270 [Deltaproteobacteria bacterium]|nr:MAG: hypothetical protein E6J91_11270 [Deltaproteobacteria bacterium]
MLSPLYVANEYVLRRPLGAVVQHAERERWADTVVDWFTFGENRQHLIVPTALYDFGLLPCVGFYYSGDDVFASGNQLRLHAATWGPRWINATAADRYAIDKSDRVQVRFEFKRSEDNLFFGIGPDVVRDARSRYGLERTEGSLAYRGQLTAAARLDVESGVHRIAFVEGECCGDPSLDAQIAAGAVMPPPGYRAPYTAGYLRVAVTRDTRRPRPEPGGGTYLSLQARPSFDLGGGRSWIQYGGVAGGAVDLTGHRRTLRLQLALDFVDAMSDDRIPFTEYPVLGGEGMPGFLPGWLTGRSAAAAQVGYTWPVWLGVDAQTRLTIGNAFGEHLDGFGLDKLRVSGDVGFTTSTAYDQGLELLFGLGTDTFDRGGGVTSVRVSIGTRRGF